jgi:hypothetical protein
MILLLALDAIHIGSIAVTGQDLRFAVTVLSIRWLTGIQKTIGKSDEATFQIKRRQSGGISVWTAPHSPWAGLAATADH